MPDDQADHPPGRAPAALGPGQPTGDEGFGIRLLHELDAGAANLVLSPDSIAAALRVALLGARGPTARQIAGVLGVPGPEAAAEGLRTRAGWLAALADGPAALSAPATVWVQSGLPLARDFRDMVDSLAVVMRHADFRGSPEGARAVVNGVIEDATGGAIQGLLGPGGVTALTRLVLANAVYLKAAWECPFPAPDTARAPFRDERGDRLDVPMMRLTAQLRYRAGDGYQAAVLPYRGGRLAMVVILPDGPLADFRERMTGPGLTGLAAGAAPEQLRLRLPRFHQRTRLDLGPVLGRLGMAGAFGPGADFSGIAAGEPLALGAVAHMADVRVTEQGTEAAAATAAAIRSLAARRVSAEMTVDRPFAYAIVARETGVPLFLGVVSDPSA